MRYILLSYVCVVHYDDDDNDDHDGALQLQLSEFIVPISGIVC